MMACYIKTTLLLFVIISTLLTDDVQCLCNNTRQPIGALEMLTERITNTLDNNKKEITDTLTINKNEMVSKMEIQTEQFKNLTDVVAAMSVMLSQTFTLLEERLRTRLADCSAIAAQGPYTSGIYTIAPWDDVVTKGTFEVFCDMNPDDAGWTVIQRRINGSVDFYRDWVDYKNGFGDLDDEFWLGLDKLNRLTSTRGVSWQLKVELEDFEGNTAYAVYDDFSIGDESTQFQLSIGAYSGTAGDSMSYHGGMKFSTKDRDNDPHSSNCAISYKGGWWYNTCHYSNLNGPYLTSATATSVAITWYHWTNDNYVALKRAQMKIKPVL